MQKSPRIVGYQTWQHLLFAHWRVDTDQLQNLLPEGLRVETFDGSAWLGVVPFSMERVRPWWSPPIPGISWFLETNVRTYVRHENGQTGVWFFSLDANQRLAVAVARKFWHLNYRFAQLRLSVQGETYRCSGACLRAPAAYEIDATINQSVDVSVAADGSLEHFLLERYHLFAQRPDGQFLVGQVHHTPYQFLPIRSASITETLTGSNGCPIPEGRSPDHIVYSPGVDVSVSPLSLCR